MSDFKNWLVAPMTPTRVDTPDGMISVSWRSNSDNGATDMKAEQAARLIAAAPDLLSSHGRLLANFRLLLAGKPVRDVDEMYAEAEAAIAKATGEQS